MGEITLASDKYDENSRDKCPKKMWAPHESMPRHGRRPSEGTTEQVPIY